MDDIFNVAPGKEEAAEQEQPQTEQPGAATAEPEGNSQEQPEGSATAAQENGKHVPLAALEAERKGRQDWKEKAIRYEEELKAIRQQQNPQPQTPQDPTVVLQQQILNERFNMSEQIARQQYGTSGDFDAMIDAFGEAAKANPALAMQLQRERHPWEFAYKEGKKIQALREIGDDPATFKERIRQEVLAELKAAGGGAAPSPSNPAASAPTQPLPQSLASARSSAPRGATAFSGPTPINSLFAN